MDTSNENYPGSFIQEEEKIVRLAYKEEKKFCRENTSNSVFGVT